jgi:hypothetical protein
LAARHSYPRKQAKHDVESLIRRYVSLGYPEKPLRAKASQMLRHICWLVLWSSKRLDVTPDVITSNHQSYPSSFNSKKFGLIVNLVSTYMTQDQQRWGVGFFALSPKQPHWGKSFLTKNRAQRLTCEWQPWIQGCKQRNGWHVLSYYLQLPESLALYLLSLSLFLQHCSPMIPPTSYLLNLVSLYLSPSPKHLSITISLSISLSFFLSLLLLSIFLCLSLFCSLSLSWSFVCEQPGLRIRDRMRFEFRCTCYRCLAEFILSFKTIKTWPATLLRLISWVTVI